MSLLLSLADFFAAVDSPSKPKPVIDKAIALLGEDVMVPSDLEDASVEMIVAGKRDSFNESCL